MKVKLEHIVGEIVCVSSASLWIAEDEEEFDHLPEWQQDEVKLAYDIVESFDKYASLPTSFDIHEYDMMERFCYSLSDQKKQDILLNAIRGKGAFRRFKDDVYRLEIAEQWYDYRDHCYKEIAKEFCKSNNID
ncbi:UPF0158 family protein [Halalkalibacter lacteus]|uniref:UPF0158 family protein n=1 Tax=Halalkalibacter lacteus TaxID=3090663 RepID=UPI002FC9808F